MGTWKKVLTEQDIDTDTAFGSASDSLVPSQLAVKTYADTVAALGDTTLANGKLWVGNSSGVKTERTISGDITISNTGVATIGNDKVTYAKMQDTTTNNRVLGAGTAGTIAEVQVATAMIENSAVNNDKLANNSIDESKLLANTASDGQFLTYDDTGGGFTWVNNPNTDSGDTTYTIGTAENSPEFSITLTPSSGSAQSVVIENSANITWSRSGAGVLSAGVTGVVKTSGTQTIAGAKTFSGNTTISGNLTVTGTTTTISTATLDVEDKQITLSVPDTTLTIAEASTAADGAGLLVQSHEGSTASNFSALTWNKTSKLTGWQVRDTAGATDFNIAIMEYSTNSTKPTGDAAGIGSLHFDTGDASLYIRTS